MNSSISDENSLSNASLAATLPGFESRYVDVNEVTLHYVVGGDPNAEPVVLLPAWPMTWWEYSKIMVPLAEKYYVIAADLRGMGGSSAPQFGYEKKSMARDVSALVTALGLGPVNVVGSDVGSMTAYSFAANNPGQTRTLVMLDAPHPFPVFQQIPLLPPPGTYDLDNPSRSVHPWWFAFNQIPWLSSELCSDRYSLIQDWIFDYMAVTPAAITAFDRSVFASAYRTNDSLRAVSGWFSSFTQDISDASAYQPLTIPVLALGGFSFDFLSAFLTNAAPNATVIKLAQTGHWIPNEQPEALLKHLFEFIG